MCACVCVWVCEEGEMCITDRRQHREQQSLRLTTYSLKLVVYVLFSFNNQSSYLLLQNAYNSACLDRIYPNQLDNDTERGWDRYAGAGSR